MRIAWVVFAVVVACASFAAGALLMSSCRVDVDDPHHWDVESDDSRVVEFFERIGRITSAQATTENLQARIEDAFVTRFGPHEKEWRLAIALTWYLDEQEGMDASTRLRITGLRDQYRYTADFSCIPQNLEFDTIYNALISDTEARDALTDLSRQINEYETTLRREEAWDRRIAIGGFCLGGVSIIISILGLAIRPNNAQ